MILELINFSFDAAVLTEYLIGIIKQKKPPLSFLDSDGF